MVFRRVYQFESPVDLIYERNISKCSMESPPRRRQYSITRGMCSLSQQFDFLKESTVKKPAAEPSIREPYTIDRKVEVDQSISRDDLSGIW